MLKSIYIKNYAIIDEISIDFDRGFNVFTGETGAGKSIIVGALSFLIRGKADTGVIRNSQDKAIIEGVFSIDDEMKVKLDEADIDYDDEIIVRRIISADNHNSIRINQCSVTLSFLSDLFEDRIDIHSQKDSQYLLNKNNHIRLLNKYLKDDELLSTYIKQYEDYKKALKEYDNLCNNTYNISDLEYLKYDLKELEDADLKEDEEEDLMNKEKRYKDSEKYLTILSESSQLYDGEEGIKDKLSYLYKNLNLNDETVDEIRNNIENLYYSLDDEMEKLKGILNEFNDDELNIEYIEDRLYTYSKLKRKHNKNVSELLELKNELKEKIAFYEDRDYILNQKKNELDILYQVAYKTAEKLHKVRTDRSKELEKEIISQCNDLMLNNVHFEVRIDSVDLNSNGIDDVEFFISMNKGEDLKPLKNVASGGEISRLMLSLKTVFTSLSDTSMVVFDEIDSGVSGKVALAMGQKMAEIAKNVQVLTITHLAPVAACADAHYFIYKQDNDDYSKTSIRKLNNDEIINELAMISSTDNSDVSIDAAKALYKNARESIGK